jgi:protein SCO1/2
LPEEFENIGIEPHIGAQLPLDATFQNARGETVRLGDYFDGERPVVILPVYYSCPMLCGITANALLQTAQDLKKWSPGEEYRIVTFSFDPRESTRLAKLKKENTLKEFGRDVPEDGWVFLTGEEPQIQRLTQTLGFTYKWHDKRQEYIHAAGIMVATPQGKISQYMYGVMYEPEALRLLLVEASEGEMGSPLDQLLLYCFQYDAEEGTYAWAAMRIMRAGATLTVLVLLLTITPLWIRSHFRHKQHARAAPEAGDDHAPDAERS